VHLGGGLRMIGIITATKGWIWLALYLGVFLEWFVSLNIYIIDSKEAFVALPL